MSAPVQPKQGETWRTQSGRLVEIKSLPEVHGFVSGVFQDGLDGPVWAFSVNKIGTKRPGFDLAQRVYLDAPHPDTEDALLFRALRELMGYVQNGTDTVVRLTQDDATKEFFVYVGKACHYAPSLKQAIEFAAKEHNE